MLPQTKYAVDDLKACGLKRKEFRIRTPWNARIQGYGETHITLLCSAKRRLELVPELAKRFKTKVLYLDGQPWYVLVEPSCKPSLYRCEEGEERKIQLEDWPEQFLPQISQISPSPVAQPVTLWDLPEQTA